MIGQKDDAAIVKGMVQRGDEQHNVAAWFGVNHGRISEICANKSTLGKLFKNVLPADETSLPPPGPYTSGRSAKQAQKMLIEFEKLISDSIIQMKEKTNSK